MSQEDFRKVLVLAGATRRALIRSNEPVSQSFTGIISAKFSITHHSIEI